MKPRMIPELVVVDDLDTDAELGEVGPPSDPANPDSGKARYV